MNEIFNLPCLSHMLGRFFKRSKMTDAKNAAFYDFSALDISEKKDISMKDFQGKTLLVVNIASKCGLTASNYPQLKELNDKFYDKGLRILCFPCNQFAGQEPGTNEEINQFACQYDPKFQMFAKIDVNGSNTHPLYAFLKTKCPGFGINAIKWNFTKFLVDKNGNPIKRYGPQEEPLTIIPDIEKII
ncbi:glutathione peroxidase [Rozella allomycis CSF55]|uniref:Glutathione peroxidase n=1 Tax=Rozella allomycis (strain CSF55) TaxID=988480 RepID=A0A075AQE4_ROZAC|nr:Thioredoxin-like fold domain-containing protein [Rozella allomycis CSF55]RKP19329.1 glutathione peroxidase [Rozella allomycis CSF55]|eukprot:EPZ32438.1 Thioredoxin-like fold domain-containing protein [Rozella allomycis CSF55]